MNRTSKHYTTSATLILLVMVVLASLCISETNLGVLEPKPNFTVIPTECTFDVREGGVLSLSFNITVEENPTRIPGQIVFQIIDVYKNYSFHKYKFFHHVNLTREYPLERVYQPEETLENVTFVIGNVYKDYMYLPSEYFNYQLFYCEFREQQLKALKDSKEIFDALDPYCILFFDFEHYYKDHMFAILSHPGRQCIVIPRKS